jgi:hypothetical protein
VWETAANPSGLDIVRFVGDAVSSERRIAKDVNLENEYSRYTLTTRRLEQEIVLTGRLRDARTAEEFAQVLSRGYFPTQRLAPGYLALLVRAGDDQDIARLGASFFPPDQCSTHRRAFADWVTKHDLASQPVVAQRLEFLAWAEAAGCGVVELQMAYHRASGNVDTIALSSAVNDSPHFVELPEFATSGLDLELFSSGQKRRIAEILSRQIRAALTTGEAVTFGNQAPHDVIAEVLHQFVYVPSGELPQPVQLRVIYADGSEAAPFPLFCLAAPPDGTPTGANPLRVALMSMRHVELDVDIDFCWFRNREVSRTRTLAETDEFCQTATENQLDESLALGDLALHLYHTGFEPAVIGFYRALVHRLSFLRNSSGPSLVVTPYYFRGREGYQAGSTWC